MRLVNCFCQHMVHFVNSVIRENNDPHFVGLKKLIFSIVSVNEIYGMQMHLFVNVIL